MKVKLLTNFIKRIVLLALGLLLVFAVYTTVSTGYFRDIENKFEGGILKEIALPGAEDITISHEDGFAIISSTDRSTFPAVDNTRGDLFLLDLKDETFELKNLSSHFKKPFAPHGISLFKRDSILIIAAISHTLQGHSIEFFELLRDTLLHKKTMKHPMMVSPNDLVLLDENRFYFTNDHKYTQGFGRFLEDYVGLSLSNVVYFDGENYSEAANGIAYANGINYDPERKLIFVASPRKFLIKVYSRNSDGSIDFIEDILCGTGPDNIEFNADGNLWAGAHPNLLQFAAYAKGNKETAPSEIIKIDYRTKNDYAVETIFTNDGHSMSASSVAAPYHDLILAGNVKDNKFLILKNHSKANDIP